MVHSPLGRSCPPRCSRESTCISMSVQRRERGEMDRAVAIMRAYKHLLDESVARFPFPKLVVSDYEGRWQDCYARILGFLDRLSPASGSLTAARALGRQ